ncbi:MAG: 1-acyl-sn-glycerol-3-phosphate acyltransferase [Saprospiraceae bacterium]|nr:1-acyl-sn-glycerol-3-phosphate acyltransferase [Saprospiraceae bacterium]
MLYSLVRPLAAVALKVFFKKIYLSNIDRIPQGKPVLLAANHPSAFLEPCILACFLDRPIYFLVRGDIFVKPFYIKILRALNMVPVYRLKDGGYQNLKNNFATFQYCYAALNEKKSIMILAEGRTIHEKRLRPLQKGTARIVFGAYDSFPDMEEVLVIPVGVNYTFADRPRSEAMIDFGEPIQSRKYWKTGESNATQAITDLTEELRRRLEKNVIIIDRHEDEALTEHLFELYRSENPDDTWPVISHNSERLFAEKSIADFVNHLKGEKRELLNSQVKQYFHRLKKLGVSDAAIAEKQTPVWRLPLLVAGFLPFLAGYLWNYPPVRLARYVADTRVKGIEFYSSVMIAVNLVLYVIYILLWGVIAGRAYGLAGIAGVGGMLALGYFALIYKEVYHDWTESWKAGKLSGVDKKELQKMREIIWQDVASHLPDVSKNATLASSSSIRTI